MGILTKYLQAILLPVIVGILFFTHNAQTAFGASNFTTIEVAHEWIGIDTKQNWPRNMFTIGPYKWTVTNKKNGADYATENWQAPEIFSCYKSPQDCRPLGINGGNGSRSNQWLWGMGYEPEHLKLLGLDYIVLSATDTNRLYSTNCGRGIGPAVLWETNCRGTTAYYTTGAYGWTLGNLDAYPERDGPSAVGLQMPLQWNVRGFYNNPPPVIAPAE